MMVYKKCKTEDKLTQKHHGKGASGHDDGLCGVGVDDGSKSPCDRVHRCDGQQHTDAQVQVPSQRRLDENSACEQIRLKL